MMRYSGPPRGDNFVAHDPPSPEETTHGLDEGPLSFVEHYPGVWIAAGLCPRVWAVTMKVAPRGAIQMVIVQISFDGVVQPPIFATGGDVEQALIHGSTVALAVLEALARETVTPPREIYIERTDDGFSGPPGEGEA